jgi:hypothetical protein
VGGRLDVSFHWVSMDAASSSVFACVLVTKHRRRQIRLAIFKAVSAYEIERMHASVELVRAETKLVVSPSVCAVQVEGLISILCHTSHSRIVKVTVELLVTAGTVSTHMQGRILMCALVGLNVTPLRRFAVVEQMNHSSYLRYQC